MKDVTILNYVHNNSTIYLGFYVYTSMEEVKMKRKLKFLISIVLIVTTFYFFSLVGYNLFHMTIEVSMLILGILIFTSSLLSQKLKDNRLIKVVGPGIIISSIILFLHAMTYVGMNLISGYDANLPTQLWVIANFVLALSFVIGALNTKRQLNLKIIVSGLITISVIFVVLAFSKAFPSCYIVGSGLTLFKKLSEVIIILLYLTAIYIIYRSKEFFEERFLYHIAIVIGWLIIGELLFTFYLFVDDLTNFFGHIFKLFGYLEMYWIIRVLKIDEPIEKIFDQLKMEVTKSQKSDVENKKISKIYIDLFENTPLGYQSLDENGMFLFVNAALTKMLGYSKEEMIGKWFGDFLVSSGKSTFKTNFPKFKQKGETRINIEMLTKSGEVITIMFDGKIAYKDDGTFKQTHCILKDITNEEKVLKQLIQSEKHTQLILNSTAEGIYGVDLNGLGTFVNNSFLKILGYEEEKFFIGKCIHELIHHSYEDGTPHPKELCYIKLFTLTKEVDKIGETILWKKDGTCINVEYSSNPQYENGILSGAVVTFKDITEVVKRQIKLLESFDRLDRSQKIACSGSWELDLNTNLIWGSQEAFNIYEFTMDSEYINTSQLTEIVSKEERKKLNKALADLIEDGIPYDLQFTINIGTRKKYIHSRATVSKNNEGVPIKVLGVIRDITELKLKEDELIYLSYHDSLTGLKNRRYYEDYLIKLDIPENYPLTVIMSDINGLKLINDAFGHLAGDKLLISASELISDSCRETDLVARIGGDEFVIVMPKTSGNEAEKIIDKINEQAKKIKVESIALSISFGFKTKNDVKEDIQEVFRAAEDLMYRVKLIEIPSMRSGAIETILNTLYQKDKNSEIHSRSVSNISEKLAVASGMNRQDVNEVKTAGLLHDIGKILIPISILTKEGKLTDEEYDLIKGHPEIGFRILNSTHDMRNISNIVLSHHERWDGLGYPRGIKGEEIPVQSRIIAIADAFDAMTSKRTYKNTLSYDEALKEISQNSGSQFDQKLSKIFIDNFKNIIELK